VAQKTHPRAQPHWLEISEVSPAQVDWIRRTERTPGSPVLNIIPDSPADTQCSPRTTRARVDIGWNEDCLHLVSILQPNQ
jgi:hypothetical protein